jgi:serine/threonine protein kinase
MSEVLKPVSIEPTEKTDVVISKEKESTEEIRKLGPYIIKQTLGEGGFSKVKLGIHEKTGEKVALKMLKNKSKLTKPVRKQVEREINAMTKIDHPNVLRMKEVDWDCTYTKKNGKQQNIILVVLELATGGELFEFLSYTGFFEESIARTYFQQLMSGVETCHSEGVVHRDLKPENLLLDDQFTLKIADFGFSNVVCSAHKLMFTECGTPGYMAPEMIRNPKGYDGMKADIWACGVILFIMLAGFPPFQKPDLSDWWFNKLVNGKHALFWQAHSRSAYFSDQTKDFLNKILNPDPEKRISIADMKKHAWWKGTTITNVALVSELHRRKNTVDTVKSKEKERKKKEKEKESTLTTKDMRALGDSSSEDDLPVSPPTFTFKHQVYTVAEPVMTTGGDLSFGDEEETTTETKEKKPQVLDETLIRYTRFNSVTSPSKIIDRVGEVLQKTLGLKYSSKDSYKLRVESNGMAFFVQVFADSKVDSQYVVDFRKQKGSGPEFRSLYQEIRAHLADIILQPKKETSLESTKTMEVESS